MVNEQRYRLWISRFAAPAAFFLAATILVILIQSGLSGGSAATTTAAPPTISTPIDTTQTGQPPPTGKKKVYRVRVGDTLESIAAKFKTTVDDLLSLNPGIDPLALSPGQKIRVA
jgi:LysM repeat protein